MVAAPATFFGHALAYALGPGSMADGRHAYFLPTLQAFVTLALALALALVAKRLLFTRPERADPVRVTSRSAPGRFPGFLSLWATFSLTQCALFVSIEFLEGYRVGLFGCVAQCAVALVAAAIVTFFGVALERCEELALACGTYLPRRPHRPILTTCASLCPLAARGINQRRGVLRFQRPPPSR